MHLYSATFHYLQQGLLAQLAQASALSEAEAGLYAEKAVQALVQQLAQATDANELNARWDMCRQLYLSQLLTNSEELLRTDLGWPDRRRYLAEKMLGANLIAELQATVQQPISATVLLGYLTILVLAVVGEQAGQADLNPASLGKWLKQQAPDVGKETTTKAASGKATAAKASAPKPVATGRAQASTGKARVVLLSVGCLTLLGLGGYFVVGKETPVPDAPLTQAAPVVQAEAPTLVAAAPVAATTPEVDSAEAAPPATVAPKVVVAASKATAKPVLRDTIGNDAMARAIGGRFNAAAGRYLKGEGQPLIIKLVNQATLTVGINSTESLLYKRLVNPALPRPSDLVLDRLAFDNSRASLGAEGAQQLGSVASLLKTFPKVRVLVLGHANPAEEDATKLGLKRATTAVQELQKQGIDPNRLQAQGVLATGVPKDNDSSERLAMLQGISLKISKL